MPGLKVKKKKRKNALTKKFDEDEVEYVAKKTARDEQRYVKFILTRLKTLSASKMTREFTHLEIVP